MLTIKYVWGGFFVIAITTFEYDDTYDIITARGFTKGHAAARLYRKLADTIG